MSKQELLDLNRKANFIERHAELYDRCPIFKSMVDNTVYFTEEEIHQSMALIPSMNYFAAKQVKQLLGSKKEVTEVSKFEALFYRLNALVPTYSDGTEHVMIQLLEGVCSVPKEELSEADKDFLKSIIPLLNRISKDFADYAKRLQ
jgi:hypothetical protein